MSLFIKVKLQDLLLVIREKAWWVSIIPIVFSGYSVANIDASHELQQQQVRQQEQQEQLLAPTKQDIHLDDVAHIKSSKFILNETNCFSINEIALKDLELDSNNQTKNSEQPSVFTWVLTKLLKQQQTKFPICIGNQGIRSIVSNIQNEIIEKGYTTTRVVIGPQDLKSGILTLTIVPGYIDKIKVIDSSKSPRFTKASQFLGLPIYEDTIFNLRDLEQGLENLKRVPSAEADIEIHPSQNNLPGSSDLHIKYKQNFPLRFNLSFDDSGSKSSGKHQGNATVSIDNLLTLNDLFYVNVSSALPYKKAGIGNKGNRNLSFYYSVPMKYSELSLTTSNYYYHQSVAGYSADYIYSGKSSSVNLNLDTVIYRDNKRKTSFKFGLWAKKSANFINDSEIEVQRRRMAGWEASLQHRTYINDATLDLAVSYKQGTGAKKALPAPEEYYGDGTSRPKIITASINYTKPIKFKNQLFVLTSILKSQWNKTPLIGQDRFSIGGRHSVRGFDGESSLASERGWLLRNQIDWRFANSQQLYLGLDAGRISGNAAKYQMGTTLAGFVVGIKGNLKQNINYDFFIGQPLRKPQKFKTAATVMGFNLNMAF